MSQPANDYCPHAAPTLRLIQGGRDRPTPGAMLVKHVATLSWLSADHRQHRERHAAWNAAEATRLAYTRARSMRLSGEALAFRIDHEQRAYA